MPLSYDLVERNDDDSRRTAGRIADAAARAGLIRDERQPDVVIAVGGDGTMLQAFHLHRDRLDRVAFIGVHTGHLGFFSDWKPNEIDTLVRLMAEAGSAERLRTVRHPIVQVTVTTATDERSLLALNEFTVRGAESMLVAQIRINGEPFEMFRGDGICVSSPSGSTAYNKSLGGAIIHPSIEAIQIAEMASINNRVYRTLGSPIVLPKHHHCDILPRERQKLLLTVDHLGETREDVRSIRCAVADAKVTFARLRAFPFWTRVREAFIGPDFQKP